MLTEADARIWHKRRGQSRQVLVDQRQRWITHLAFLRKLIGHEGLVLCPDRGRHIAESCSKFQSRGANSRSRWCWAKVVSKPTMIPDSLGVDGKKVLTALFVVGNLLHPVTFDASGLVDCFYRIG